MHNYDKFITNIYDPRLPDSDSKLVSDTAEPSKRVALLKFMRDMLDQYDIGEPCETHAVSLKKLKENNIVGLYKSERTVNLGTLSLLQNFKVDIKASGVKEEEAKPQLGFRKRPKQMYKFPKPGLDKNDVLMIDDYVPPPPIRED